MNGLQRPTQAPTSTKHQLVPCFAYQSTSNRLRPTSTYPKLCSAGMQPQTFKHLPAELRNAIWHLAIPTVTFHVTVQLGKRPWQRHVRCSMTADPDVKHRNNLLLVCKESSTVFKSVKKVCNFNPVDKPIRGRNGKKWKVSVKTINLDPNYDTFDFSARGARAADFAKVFPELASRLNAAVICFRETPSLWWIVANALPRVRTLTVVITDAREQRRLCDEIKSRYPQPQIELRVNGVIRPQVTQKTVIYSKMNSIKDSRRATAFCGNLNTRFPDSLLEPGS